MSNRLTDHKNLNLAELHRQVIRGTSGGKIIWQPRIGCWLTDKQFDNEPIPPPFDRLPYEAYFDELECSARIYEYNRCFRAIEHPAVKRIDEELPGGIVKTTIKTPVGEQVQLDRHSSNSPRMLHVKRIIESREELKVATWRLDNAGWEWDQNEFERLNQKWGNRGLPTMYMPRVNVQDLYISTMSTEKAIYAIYDWTDQVETYFRALDDNHERLMYIINASPVDVINFGDNIHCGTLPPYLYEKYVLPAYLKRCDLLHQANKFISAHWDGDVKALLPYAKISGLDGIEAITPKPQGDVTIEETKDALGDDIFLLDGIPAILFDSTFPVSMLEEFTLRVIELFAPKLILGISDEISSHGEIDRIRVVGKIVDDYNASVGRKE
ncbi:hypothetical protein JXJ21_13030 [candidate division KSB1 bacterium]|nr:hypothetical protein [candidate division KSB1 bacterium]